MKSSILTRALVAAIGALVAPTVIADECENLPRGSQCTNLQGQQSRCSKSDMCINNLTACSSTSKLLQSCHSLKTLYRYPLFDDEPLQCINLTQIDTIVQRATCIDKSDGTACKSAYSYMNGKAGHSATVYEQDGVCEKSYCLSMIYASCNDKSTYDPCTYDGFDNGDIMRFNGTCRSNFPYRNKCEKSGSGTFVRSAKVVVANAPIPTTTAPPATASTARPSAPSSSYESESKGGGLSTRCIIGIVASVFSLILCVIRLATTDESVEKEEVVSENKEEELAAAYAVAVEEGRATSAGWGLAVPVQDGTGAAPVKNV